MIATNQSNDGLYQIKFSTLKYFTELAFQIKNANLVVFDSPTKYS